MQTFLVKRLLSHKFSVVCVSRLSNTGIICQREKLSLGSDLTAHAMFSQWAHILVFLDWHYSKNLMPWQNIPEIIQILQNSSGRRSLIQTEKRFFDRNWTQMHSRSYFPSVFKISCHAGAIEVIPIV